MGKFVFEMKPFLHKVEVHRFQKRLGISHLNIFLDVSGSYCFYYLNLKARKSRKGKRTQAHTVEYQTPMQFHTTSYFAQECCL